MNKISNILITVARFAPVVVARNTNSAIRNVIRPSIIIGNTRNFSSYLCRSPTAKPLLSNPNVTQLASNIVSRNLIKFSYRKGRRKALKDVLQRFYRLHWGGWIRTKCGRHKKLWKKSPPRKRRLRQHVLCNATQSFMLDKMVGSFWRKPKYYVDDPYEPYHSREEWQFTYTKPRPYFPPDQQ